MAQCLAQFFHLSFPPSCAHLVADILDPAGVSTLELTSLKNFFAKRVDGEYPRLGHKRTPRLSVPSEIPRVTITDTRVLELMQLMDSRPPGEADILWDQTSFVSAGTPLLAVLRKRYLPG